MTGDTSVSYLSAVHDFHFARRRAEIEELLARLGGRDSQLLAYEEVRNQLRGVESSSRVLKDVPLKAIIGSVGRYHDFTRSFLPRVDRGLERWARVKQAATSMVGLAPVELYQIGDAYFVSDGHHRLSVAADLGATHIEAYVTPVQTRVGLDPSVRPDELIIKAEYTRFLERTGLDEIRPGADLTVTTPGQYKAFEEHIDVHRYYMGLEQDREIPYEEAVAHWYDEFYLPVAEYIRERGILKEFPGRTAADLYLWTADHLAELQQQLNWPIEPEIATEDLVAEYGRRPGRVLARTRHKLVDVMTPDRLEAGPQPGQWRDERLDVRDEDRLFHDILVALDGEQTGWRGLQAALWLARHEGARVLGLHVVAKGMDPESDKMRALRTEFDRRCSAAQVQGHFSVETGRVARLVCERSRWVDLITLSLACPPDPGVVARIGSVTSTIIRRCPRPVLVVPAPVPDGACEWPGFILESGEFAPESALLAYDGSPKATEALFVATYLAGRLGLALTVLTIVDGERVTRTTLEQARDYLAAHSVSAQYVADSGGVSEGILAAAEEREIDLLLMGGYGFAPVLEIVVGSAVHDVLRIGRRPVLICR